MRVSTVLLLLTVLVCVYQSDAVYRRGVTRRVIRRIIGKKSIGAFVRSRDYGRYIIRRMLGLTKKSIESPDEDLTAKIIARQLRDVGHEQKEEARALDLLTMVLKRSIEDQD